MLSNLIIDGVMKGFQNKIQRYLLEKRRNYIQSYKTCLLWLMPMIIMEILFCGIANVKLVTGYTAEEVIGNPNALRLLYPDHDYRHEIQKKFLTSRKEL